ncbi:hypothetical protein, partial [Rhizobium leguminosarum]|uniref:hypothetical protein n=1 Tax=Rhizobium leguminosarum TaxID=384 RepID=UPI001C98126D
NLRNRAAHDAPPATPPTMMTFILLPANAITVSLCNVRDYFEISAVPRCSPNLDEMSQPRPGERKPGRTSNGSAAQPRLRFLASPTKLFATTT